MLRDAARETMFFSDVFPPLYVPPPPPPQTVDEAPQHQFPATWETISPLSQICSGEEAILCISVEHQHCTEVTSPVSKDTTR